MSGPEYLLWLDVETTGLNAHQDKLLQVAAVLTDPAAVTEYGMFERVIRYSQRDMKSMFRSANDIVRKMHESTGLWTKLPAGEPISQVDEGLSQWLQGLTPGKRSVRLAGNSVRLDLNFVEAQLPGTYSHLHYRSVDVSALAYALAVNRFASGYYPKSKQHEAMADIRESIAEYRWLMGQLDALR